MLQKSNASSVLSLVGDEYTVCLAGIWRDLPLAVQRV